MTPPRAVSVVGFKDSGKTRVVEALVGELTRRGLKVGTLKHTAENIDLDTPGKDTRRHREAGAVASAILHENAVALFVDGHVTLADAVTRLGRLDLVVIEGFKTLDTHARILVPREDADVDRLRNGLEIAAVKVPCSAYTGAGLTALELSDAAGLADLVESKAYPMLPGADCHGCGYPDCRSLGQAILGGDAEATRCVRNYEAFTLKLNGESVPLNNFVRRALTNMLMGFIKALKGGENAERVELSFEVDRDG